MSDAPLPLWRVKNYLRGVLPYVSRKKFDRLLREHRALLDVVACTPGACSARIHTLKALEQPLAGEVCLFVTHAGQPELKRHVVDHIEQLRAAGIAVVLVVNSDFDAGTLRIAPALLQSLRAAYVRENIGFDFAAWSHVIALCLQGRAVTRLYLVNDSVVGPLHKPAFEAVIRRIRESTADVVGLTDNAWPRLHLQSYFLVFSERAQRSAVWRAVFTDSLAFADKQQVIDVYETQVTAQLQRAGLSTECLFPAVGIDPRFTSDVHFRWRELVERGMPFVKTSIVRERLDDPEMIALVPEAYRRELSVD